MTFPGADRSPRLEAHRVFDVSGIARVQTLGRDDEHAPHGVLDTEVLANHFGASTSADRAVKAPAALLISYRKAKRQLVP